MNVYLVPVDSPLKSIADVVRQTRASGKPMSVGTYSAGYQLAAAWFANLAGIRFVNVPYKGQAQIMTDVPVHTEAPPLPPLSLERPHIDLIVPDVPITETTPDAPTAVPVEQAAPPAVASAPAKATPGPVEPVIPITRSST